MGHASTIRNRERAMTRSLGGAAAPSVKRQARRRSRLGILWGDRVCLPRSRDRRWSILIRRGPEDRSSRTMGVWGKCTMRLGCSDANFPSSLPGRFSIPAPEEGRCRSPRSHAATSHLALHQPPVEGRNSAQWRINGYGATITVWTAEEWERLAERPTDAQHYPDCGIWCALRVDESAG